MTQVFVKTQVLQFNFQIVNLIYFIYMHQTLV